MDVNSQACVPSGSAGACDPCEITIQPRRVCLTHDDVPASGHQAVGDELQGMRAQGISQVVLQGAIVGRQGEDRGLRGGRRLDEKPTRCTR